MENYKLDKSHILSHSKTLVDESTMDCRKITFHPRTVVSETSMHASLHGKCSSFGDPNRLPLARDAENLPKKTIACLPNSCSGSHMSRPRLALYDA